MLFRSLYAVILGVIAYVAFRLTKQSVGVPLGLVIGVVSSITAHKALYWYLEFMHSYRPAYPICKKGKCTHNNYHTKLLDDGQVAWFCECGDRYARKGHTFYEVMPDGTRRPYMYFRGLGRWRKVDPE